MIKKSIKKHLSFVIQGFIINTILYCVSNILINNDDIIPAAAVVVAMLINGFIYLIGCIKGLLDIISEPPERNNSD